MTISGRVKPPFETISLPRKDVVQSELGRYRIYSDAQNHVSVEAASAAEAFKASGIEQAWRIERDMVALTNVLEPQEPGADVVVPVAAKPEVAAAEASLSSDDVDKLLSGAA